jgi:hypothetical protein
MRFILGTAVVAVALTSAVAMANEPATTPSASDACVACHATETAAWQGSAHAKAQVSCETCHGPLVPDHPAKPGSMKIEVESSGCRTCHASTYEQWKSSPHAKMGVQCIACHLSHSQTARLTDESLCGSCHRQILTEAAHGAHAQAHIGCVNCHASSPDGKQAPNHTFTVVSDNCVSCHGKTIHEFAAQAASTSQEAQVQQTLSVRLQQCEETNRTLVPLMAVNLGLGLGVGGLAGAVVVLGVLYLRERRARG